MSVFKLIVEELTKEKAILDLVLKTHQESCFFHVSLEKLLTVLNQESYKRARNSSELQD